MFRYKISYFGYFGLGYFPHPIPKITLILRKKIFRKAIDFIKFFVLPFIKTESFCITKKLLKLFLLASECAHQTGMFGEIPFYREQISASVLKPRNKV
ncbi:hypothetical protein A9G30_05600 [Gilliamella sp. Fer4-1]|nr:hypothetical protein A9G30_05600 [Gilliamella apicola]